jgi:nucleoside-diphosphate-sugar epimerase
MTSQKPHFSLVTIHPTFVFGHNILQSTAEELAGSTNGILFNRIMTGVTGPTVNCVHVLDVADAHIRALDPNIVKSSDSFLVSGAVPTSEETVGTLQKYYADAGWKVKADTEAPSWAIDTSKAERGLGMKWRSYEEMVREVMDQQLGLLKAASV